MSLKAYDGMMTRNGLAYIQEEILKRFDKFEVASQNALAKTYADDIILHVDDNYNIIDQVKINSINESVGVKEDIKNIEIKDDTTLISYLFQAGKILSTGLYKNEFMVDLSLFIYCKDDKILIFPNINVDEHKKILLEFLTDWYCQNQTDQDENVDEEEWNERTQDWYGFNKHKGLSMKIMIFDPNHYYNNFNNFFRGDILYQKILENIPSDEKRKRKIATNILIDEKSKNENDESYSKIWNIMGELKKEGNTEIDDYINSHDILLVKIDKEFLEKELLKNPSV
jgi:hypothetical protein